MKLTKNKWVNLAILKVIEGLGIIFIPYLVGFIPLAIWPVLQQELYIDSVFSTWWFGIALILAPVLIVGSIRGIIELKRDRHDER